MVGNPFSSWTSRHHEQERGISEKDMIIVYETCDCCVCSKKYHMRTGPRPRDSQPQFCSLHKQVIGWFIAPLSIDTVVKRVIKCYK